jgi:hypothetical protein
MNLARKDSSSKLLKTKAATGRRTPNDFGLWTIFQKVS